MLRLTTRNDIQHSLLTSPMSMVKANADSRFYALWCLEYEETRFAGLIRTYQVLTEQHPIHFVQDPWPC